MPHGKHSRYQANRQRDEQVASVLPQIPQSTIPEAWQNLHTTDAVGTRHRASISHQV
jgi:hypothetical protein